MKAQAMAMGLLRSMKRPDVWLRKLAPLGDVHFPRPLPLNRHGTQERQGSQEKYGHPPLPSALPAPVDRAVQPLLGATDTAEKRPAAIRDSIPAGDRAFIEKTLLPTACTGKKEDKDAPEPDQEEVKRAP